MVKNNKTKKLGNNPLDWIGKDKEPSSVKKDKTLKKEEKKSSENKITSQPEDKEKRETFIVKVSLSEKIKDYAYWERMKQKDVLNSILEEFFKDKNIKQRPEEK